MKDDATTMTLDAAPTRIQDRALLAKLSISQWTARKKDRAVTRDAQERWKADTDSGRYTKDLLAGAALDAIRSAASTARKLHNHFTLPWGDDGERILPADGFMAYSQQMRQCRSEFETAVTDFLAAYPGYVEQSKARLGEMFRGEDYPAAADMGDRFEFGVSFLPLPNAEDLRLGISEEGVERIRKDTERQVQEATAEGMRDVWQRLYDAVNHMAERLSEPDAIFRDSLVGNVKELIDVLPLLNLTDDPNLEAMRRTVAESLAGRKPEELRRNKDERREAAHKAGEILSAMGAFMGSPQGQGDEEATK